MMEKVKLMPAQADAIEKALKYNGEDKEQLINKHADNKWITDTYSALNDLSQADMARAVLIGYEVEEEYKVGDKIVHLHDRHPGVYTVREVHFHGVLVGEFFDLEFRIKDIRHATPEEIKAEQERRVWAGIGREVGEFCDGDFAFSGYTGYHSHEATVLKDWYDKGKLKGFYPAESFISFGGESHDN